MSEFQSNYPREAVVGVERRDIDRLSQVTRSGLVWAIANGLSITLLLVSLFLFARERKFTALYGCLFLVTIGTGIFLALAIFVWVRVAHRTACRLRNLEPRMSSELIAFLSAVPAILGYLPLSYTLEFILIRSNSEDTPVLKWYSAWSKSWEANAFAVAAFFSAACFFCSFFNQLFAVERQALVYTSIVLYDIALIIGTRMVLKSNQNLKALFESKIP